jgi:O-antigen/teichoic acid export membrane protein
MLSKHLIAYLLPNLAQVFASFGTVWVLTRFLTSAEYGRFNEIFTIMTIVHYIFLTWAEAAAGRFFANAREENNIANHFATILLSYIANCILFTIFAIIFLAIFKTDAHTHLALVAAFVGAIIRSLLKIALETRRMNLQAMRFGMVEGFHIFVGFILSAIGVILLGYKQEAAFIGTMIAAVFALGFELPSILKSTKGGKFDANLFKSYFKFGYPISLSLILATILNTGDRLIIEPILGAAQVGIYSAGYQVAQRILDIFFAYTSSATFPLLVNAYESKDKAQFEATAKSNFALRIGLGAPVAIGIALVAAPLCDILIGESMRQEAARIAPYIAIAGLLLGISDYFADAFLLSKRVFTRTILLIFPVLLNIGLNIYLLPKFGIFGAVYATIGSYALGLVLMIVVGRQQVKLPIPIDETLKIAFALIIMAALVTQIPRFGGLIELIIKGTIGAVIYASFAYYLNFANARQIINAMIKKLKRI